MNFSKILAVFFTLALFLTEKNVLARKSDIMFKKNTIIKTTPYFVLDKFNGIRSLIKKNKGFDILIGQKDFLILIFDFFPENGNNKESSRIKTAKYLILFDGIEIESGKNKEKISVVIKKFMPEFIDGQDYNIKAIFWLDSGKPLSWHRGDNFIKEEKGCDCGCYEGFFSLGLCVHQDCPLVKK